MTDNHETPGNNAPTAKKVSLNTPTPRSGIAKSFLGEEVGTPENIEQPAQNRSVSEKSLSPANTVKNNAGDRKHKAAIRYMQQQGIKDVDSIKYTRLNCDIPAELHNWLNMFSRSGNEDYSSMTEIVIEQLGNFAKEHGFKVRKK